MSTSYEGESESDTDTSSSFFEATPPPSITFPSRVERNAPPPNARKRVDVATRLLSQDRCLLEETPSSAIVDYAYALPRATSRELLNRLEYSWGMKWRTLNVNTRYNIFRLGIKFRSLFDDNKWLLLPSRAIVERYYNAVMAGERIRHETTGEDTSYEYTLVAHPDMIDVPILRRNLSVSGYPPPPSAYTILTYPYAELGSLRSHISPRYVICNTAQKLASSEVLLAYQRTARELAGKTTAAELGDLLRMVYFIYKAWKKPVANPTSFLIEDGNEDCSDTSKRTGGCRATTIHGVKRLHDERSESIESSRSPDGKRRRADEGTTRLRRRTLLKLDEKTRLSRRKNKFGSIQNWAAEIATSGESRSAPSISAQMDVVSST